MKEVLGELNQWIEGGEDIALATVIETWGSSPRPLGSKMLVTRSGKMAGSVSNGCIEGAVFEEAQKVLKSGVPKIAAFGVADDVADIRNIHDLLDAKPDVLERPADDVGDEIAVQVPDVLAVVDRRAAVVHADFTGTQRHERLHRSRGAVVDAEVSGFGSLDQFVLLGASSSREPPPARRSHRLHRSRPGHRSSWP